MNWKKGYTQELRTELFKKYDICCPEMMFQPIFGSCKGSFKKGKCDKCVRQTYKAVICGNFWYKLKYLLYRFPQWACELFNIILQDYFMDDVGFFALIFIIMVVTLFYIICVISALGGV